MERSWLPLRSGVLNADCTVISLIWVLWHALGVYGMERVGAIPQEGEIQQMGIYKISLLGKSYSFCFKRFRFGLHIRDMTLHLKKKFAFVPRVGKSILGSTPRERVF